VYLLLVHFAPNENLLLWSRVPIVNPSVLHSTPIAKLVGLHSIPIIHLHLTPIAKLPLLHSVPSVNLVVWELLGDVTLLLMHSLP
jgi:hypothetical protein